MKQFVLYRNLGDRWNGIQAFQQTLGSNPGISKKPAIHRHGTRVRA